MNKYDVLIVGAGPAGLFTAIMCAEKKQRIAILEKNKSCGRKLLMAGGGESKITQTGGIYHFF